MTLKQGITPLNNIDPNLQALFTHSELEQRLERLAKSVRLNWPIQTFSHLTAYKKRAKTEELRQWSRLPSKGMSVLSFADDKYGNCWLYKPDLFKPSRFITALRLRSDMTGDRPTLYKSVPQSTVSCRRCGLQLQTLAHVLGQCTHTKKIKE
jgi:hypothetical protein